MVGHDRWRRALQLQQMLPIARCPLPVSHYRLPIRQRTASSTAKIALIKTSARLLSYTLLRSYEG